MKKKRISSEIGFNVERSIEYIESYTNSTGVNCTLIDSRGQNLYSTSKTLSICEFCNKIGEESGKGKICGNSHLYGSYQAEKLGGKYIFFCPMGLVHWASPITRNGIMTAAIVAGPVQMVNAEDFLLEDIILKNDIGHNHLEIIKKYINEVPIIKPDIVNSMSKLLFLVAENISDVQPSAYYQEREEYFEQQSHISEYIQYIKTMGGDEKSLETYPIEKEKELLSLISLGDKPASQKLLNEILAHIFFSNGSNFEIIKARVLELVVMLSRAALEGGADVEMIFGLNYKYLGQIHNFKTVEDLAYWLSEIMSRFTDCVFNLTDVKHVDVIYKAIDYIKQNYMEKITLEDVASHVYLSPSYFSKIFKEEMDLNFNAYLNHIRIEMSKKLLLDDSIVLVDVSNLVGYEDQSYFSKVFKKLTGVSPGNFRKSRGKIKKHAAVSSA
jgi:two-component system, response regulator YesN